MDISTVADKRPLRIWQICESYPPKYGGGAGVAARDISVGLAASGHEVRVLTTESRERPDFSVRTEANAGVRIDRVNLRYLAGQDPDGWSLGMRAWRRHEKRVARFIESQIEAWRPDIVQYHATRPLGEVTIPLLARRGIPVVAMLHEGWLICGRVMLLRSPMAEPCAGPGPLKCLECMYSHYDRSHLRATLKLSWRLPRLGVYPLYRLLRRRTARRSLTRGVSYSQFMVNVHRPYLPASITYIQLGMNLDGLPSERPARPRTPLRFGFFGGFQANKGIWHLLDAVARMNADGLEFELYIWGPAGPQDEREVTERKLQTRVRMRGMYEEDEMWRNYCDIDVAVMATTVCEPFGRIPLEARATGAPTIGPAIGGISESIRDGVNGLLYPFGDAQGLERQLRRILTEPGLFERLSGELQPVRETRAMVSELESVYRSVLASV